MQVPLAHLPATEENLKPEHTRRHREECGPNYLFACLEYAQSLWLAGKPAQAILQINKAFLADAPLPEEYCPYQALAEILRQPSKENFIGNPVRHFQHLATRMSGPRSELRTWRAWACFHLAESILPTSGFPRDQAQVNREAITIPSIVTVFDHLPAEDTSRLCLCGL